MKLSEIKITPLVDTLRLEDIDDDIYFSEKYANYISNSRLTLINPDQDGSPEKFFETRPKLYSDSLVFGSAVHELVLQPENFELIESVDRPTAKAGAMAEELFKSNGVPPTDDEIRAASQKIDYYKNSLNAKRISELRDKCNSYWRGRAIFESGYDFKKTPIYLDAKSRDKLKEVLKSLNKNKDIQNLLHPGIGMSANERAILMDIKVEVPGEKPFKLRLKSKLDNYNIDLDNNVITVNDLKTTGKYITDFEKSITKYHYYREMAMYCWLLQLYVKYKLKESGLKEEPFNIKSNFLAVETFPDYYTKVSPMTKELFKKGFEEFRKLLKTVAFYCCNGYEGFREEIDV